MQFNKSTKKWRQTLAYTAWFDCRLCTTRLWNCLHNFSQGWRLEGWLLENFVVIHDWRHSSPVLVGRLAVHRYSIWLVNLIYVLYTVYGTVFSHISNQIHKLTINLPLLFCPKMAPRCRLWPFKGQKKSWPPLKVSILMALPPWNGLRNGFSRNKMIIPRPIYSTAAVS